MSTGKVASRVARDLMRDARSRQLKESGSLAAEHDIIADLGASRGSVREALRLLEGYGAVSLHRGAGGGARLAMPRREQLALPLSMLLEFRDGTLATVIEARSIIEPTLAALAARRRTDEQVQALQDCVVDLRRSTSDADSDRYHRANRRFHDVVAEAAGNELLLVVMLSLSWISAAIGWEHQQPRRRARMAEAKAEIAAAIEGRDSLAASDLMRGIFHLPPGSRKDEELLARPIIWADVDELFEKNFGND